MSIRFENNERQESFKVGDDGIAYIDENFLNGGNSEKEDGREKNEVRFKRETEISASGFTGFLQADVRAVRKGEKGKRDVATYIFLENLDAEENQTGVVEVYRDGEWIELNKRETFSARCSDEKKVPKSKQGGKD